MSDAADAGLPSLPQDNPFREAQWSTPHGLPPFDRIRPEHYGPAFEAALAAHDSEIRAIAGQTAPATFANTVAAMERAGLALERFDGRGVASWEPSRHAAGTKVCGQRLTGQQLTDGGSGGEVEGRAARTESQMG